MLSSTLEVIKAGLKTDPSVSPQDRTRLLAILRNGPNETKPSPTLPEVPRILRRSEAAARLGCSLRTIDSWAKAGILVKVRLPGRKRCAGFREADVSALIQGVQK